jgi:hypothetical protein
LLGIEFKASHILGKHLTTEIHPQTLSSLDVEQQKGTVAPGQLQGHRENSRHSTIYCVANYDVPEARYIK